MRIKLIRKLSTFLVVSASILLVSKAFWGTAPEPGENE
jgi:hypothetical protein